MLRQILMLMALLSGLAALCAPEQAHAAQQHASQVEAGETLDGDADPAIYVTAFSQSASRDVAPASRPVAAFEPKLANVRVGVDRARE